MTNVQNLHVIAPAKKIVRRRKASASLRQARKQALAGVAVGAVALTLTGLSLTHLSHGIEIVTKSPSWESWSMAIGIDISFVALEMAQITSGEKLRKAVARWTKPAIAGTLAGSAVLNGFAFAAAATGWMLYPAVALGVAVPALVYALTRVGGTIWLAR